MAQDQTYESIESQGSAICKWMFKHPNRTISSLQALNMVGTMKLPTRISELRAKGFRISDGWVTENKKRFKVYFMMPDDAAYNEANFKDLITNPVNIGL